jgi:hypothetical protein
MNKTLSTYEAADYLMQDENANWSYPGAFALVEYLEEMEEGCDTAIEMDVVAIRCEYSEYEDLEAWAKEYHGTEYLLEACESMGIDEDVAMSDDFDAIQDAIREYIQERGQLIEFDGGIIVSSF